MSKAFTRESDDAPEEQLAPRRVPLPPGVKNLITPDGARRFRAELDALLQARKESGKETFENEPRIAWLSEVLQSAEVAPARSSDDRVWFGAQVKVRERGEIENYRIVGVDETDLDRGWISWRSPLARALMSRAVGEQVRFQAPGGPRDLEIIEIAPGE